MKKIGLVGGTGPESTLMYYKELNARIDWITNEAQMPDVAIESVDFRRAWRYVSSGAYDDLADYLAEKVNSLRIGGAEVISLTAATMHLVFNEVQEKTGVSLVSIPKAVCEAALADGKDKKNLLASFTEHPEYLADVSSSEHNDSWDLGPEMSRPARNQTLVYTSGYGDRSACRVNRVLFL